MRVIGLTGRARAGKDTVAQMIVESALPDQTIKREGFADRLKLSAARLFNPDATLDEALALCDRIKLSDEIVLRGADTRITRAIVSGRQLLQRYGTEAHRDVFGEDFWLDAVLPVRPSRNDCDTLVVPDVRFNNEAERVRTCGGTVWEIVRPGEGAAEAHASEQPLDPGLVDVRIVNDGTLDELREKVLRVL